VKADVAMNEDAVAVIDHHGLAASSVPIRRNL
jgi:hypothetical protein